MKLVSNVLMAAAGCLASTALLAADLAGYWKNEEQPAWIEIQFDDQTGTGTVRRNDNKPGASGFTLLKDIVSDPDDPASWSGQIYAERLKEYKDAEITLPEPDHLQIKVKVGFMSRTVNWRRAEALPAE